MADTFTLKVIARIKSDFTQKFGIPRQSSLGAVSYTHLTLPTT